MKYGWRVSSSLSKQCLAVSITPFHVPGAVTETAEQYVKRQPPARGMISCPRAGSTESGWTVSVSLLVKGSEAGQASLELLRSGAIRVRYPSSDALAAPAGAASAASIASTPTNMPAGGERFHIVFIYSPGFLGIVVIDRDGVRFAPGRRRRTARSPLRNWSRPRPGTVPPWPLRRGKRTRPPSRNARRGHPIWRGPHGADRIEPGRPAVRPGALRF